MPTVEAEGLDLGYRALCPACLLIEGVERTMHVFHVSSEEVPPPGRMFATHAYMGVVAVCHKCRAVVPLQHGITPEERAALRQISQACENYVGVCENCHRPPDEHDDIG